MNIREALNQFLAYGSSYWSARTYVFYSKNISYFMDYLESVYGDLEGVEVADLHDTVLVEYLVSLRAKQKYDNHPLYGSMNVNGLIKSNTVNSYMRAVKVFMNWLYAQRLTKVRFTEGLKLPKQDDDQIVVLTNDEVGQIDRIFDLEVPTDLRNVCMIHLMLDAGLRSCEVIALKSKDIIFDTRTIIINRGKGDKSRAVILCPRLEYLLRKYFEVFSPVGSLFKKTTENKGITEAVMKSVFLRIIRNTDVARVHPHLLRHTFATSYIMGGGNLETLRILLGHFDYSVTRKYLHLAAQNQILHTEVYRLDPVFFRSSY